MSKKEEDTDSKQETIDKDNKDNKDNKNKKDKDKDKKRFGRG